MVTTLLYAAASLYRYWAMQAGGDLAIFAEAVKRYSNGDLPWSNIKAIEGFNLLGDHFSPAIALAAPIYRIWPHAWVLLIVQAALIGLTAAVLTRTAISRIGTGWGVGLGAAYALSWGSQGLALFDFHEVAFALPLIAIVYLHLLNGRYLSASLLSLPLMLVKEDSVFLILGVSLVLLARRQWRLALLLAMAGIASFALIVGLVIPRINWYGKYTYWPSSATGGNDLLGGIATNVVHSWSSGQAPLLLAILLVPTAGMALRSPLILGILPPLSSRFTSPQESYWGPNFHYNGTIAVIVIVAMLDGLTRIERRRLPIVMFGGLTAATIMAFVGPLGKLATSPACGDCHSAVMRVLNSQIPDGARVVAADTAAPYLVDRVKVYGLHRQFLDSTGRPVRPDYIVIDKVRDQGWQENWFNAQYEQIDFLLLGEAVRLGQDGNLDYDYAVLQPRRAG